jgi:general secretion pathway protein G
MQRRRIRNHRDGFSLIELVMVVVVIAVIGAIAIPRLSRGAAGANDSALLENLNALRKAIDLYAAEHANRFPTLANIGVQLTVYTDETGTSTSTTPDFTHAFGPYLQRIPAVNTGPRVGQNGIGPADGPTIGWIYVAAKGEIRPNAPGFVAIDGEVGQLELGPE